MSEASKPLIHVACGVLVNAAGEVLLAQRPEGKIAAGWWEFPGGKIELGESPLQALTRELREELGVTVRQAKPLIRFRHDYSNRSIVLDTWRVTAFDGEPRGCEGQALRWLPVEQFADVSPLLPTVVPIEQALRTPAHYVFTPPQITPGELLAGLARLPRGRSFPFRRGVCRPAAGAVCVRVCAHLTAKLICGILPRTTSFDGNNDYIRRPEQAPLRIDHLHARRRELAPPPGPAAAMARPWD